MTEQEVDTQRAVADLIETYRQGILQLDPGRLGSIWDREHVPLIYVAMERPEPILGWPAIAGYFEALPQHLEQMVEKTIDPMKIDVFDDAAAAFFEFHSIVRLKGGEGLYRPSGRVTCCSSERGLGGVPSTITSRRWPRRRPIKSVE
jgi:hypothetical protein